MFFSWGKKNADETLDEGFIDCPHCQKRQPAVVARHIQTSHISFITFGRTEGPEQIRCQACGSFFGSNEQTGFGHRESCQLELLRMRASCAYARINARTVVFDSRVDGHRFLR